MLLVRPMEGEATVTSEQGSTMQVLLELLLSLRLDGWPDMKLQDCIPEKLLQSIQTFVGTQSDPGLGTQGPTGRDLL